MTAEPVNPKPGKCPECGSPTSPVYRPFCSKRCADIDLGRWLTGSYAIAGGNADAEEDGEIQDVDILPGGAGHRTED